MGYATKSNNSVNETAADSFDLIPVLPNEVTLGPLMACMPWYMKPQLMTLNKTWNSTLKNPFYATPHYNPRALKNSVIFCTHTPTGNGHSLALHIYQDGFLRRLPLPRHIPADSFKFTRFFVTDQCVYSLTPAADQHTYTYHITQLDLGGGMINWQTLPSLPNIGEYIHILSNISEDGNSTHDYIWIRDNADAIEHQFFSVEERRTMAEANDWSVWELHAATRREDKCQSIPPPPPAQPMESFANHLPSYLELCKTDKSRYKFLFKLYTVCGCSLSIDLGNLIEKLSTANHGTILESTSNRPCLVIFKDDNDSYCVISGYVLWKKANINGSIKIVLYKRCLQNAKTLEGEELDEFYETWKTFQPNWGLSFPEQLKAVRCLATTSIYVIRQQMFRLPSSKADGLVLSELSTLKMAQQGTMYIYLYCATSK